MEAARVAAATRHLTFAQLGIWQAGVAFEGADPPLGMDDASEPALARPAGLQAEAGSRLGPSHARLLEQMRARPEPVKVLVVIHDGQPDDPSTAMRKSRFEAEARIEALGLGVGIEEENRAEMRNLIGDRFIECPALASLVSMLTAVLNTLRQ